MPEPLQSVAGAGNQAEAELICSRLLEAGIHAISQRNFGGPEFGGSGSRTVFVDERDAVRAREILATDEEPVNEDELARLSEEAGRKALED